MIKSIEIIKPEITSNVTPDPKSVEINVIVKFEPNYEKTTELEDIEFDKPLNEIIIGCVNGNYVEEHNEEPYNKTITVSFVNLDKNIKTTDFVVEHKLYRDGEEEERESAKSTHTWPKPKD
ncbi:hypothetical protein ACFLQ5_01215 [Bacteroidota bacterium]